MAIGFQVEARCGAARAGRLETPHGVVKTPAFMPVATRGAVKGLAPDRLEEAGASIALANLYHLFLRPGISTIESLGGLHAFTGWERPILTDSGGFQVFSLEGLRKVDDDGVTFRSHLDGALVRFTPEQVVEDQVRLGVDVAMVLDECPPWPVTRDQAARSLRRSTHWAQRAREAWKGGPGGLFGIVQGSVFPELRSQSAKDLVALDFDGYGIGGVSVGEPGEHRRSVVEITAPLLPEEKPRYLMGVGYPRDIWHGVSAGVDLFDCVLPARNARHGVLFTRQGVLRIRNARFREDPRPVDSQCECVACRRLSRAALHFFSRHEDLTGKVLATLHNVRYYLDFMSDLRQAIRSGTLAESAQRPDIRDDGELA